MVGTYFFRDCLWNLYLHFYVTKNWRRKKINNQIKVDMSFQAQQKICFNVANTHLVLITTMMPWQSSITLSWFSESLTFHLLWWTFHEMSFALNGYWSIHCIMKHRTIALKTIVTECPFYWYEIVCSETVSIKINLKVQEPMKFGNTMFC